MTKLLFWKTIALQTLLVFTAIAQDNKYSYQSYLRDVIVLDKYGFLVVLGGGEFVHLTDDGKEQWKQKVQDAYSIAQSPSGQVVYCADFLPGFTPSLKKKHSVTLLRNNGLAKSTQVQPSDNFGKQLQAIFADDKYFYYLATENGDERHKTKKTNERLVLNRYSVDDFSYKRIIIPAPSVSEGDNSTYWRFIGQYKDEKYLISKVIDERSSRNFFKVVAFDEEGNITRSFDLAFGLSGDKYVRPAFSVDLPRKEFLDYSRLDFSEKTTTAPLTGNPTGFSTSNTSLVPTNGGFGHLLLDRVTGNFYIFSLFGPKPFQKVGSVYEGYCIVKYDNLGQELWSVQEQGSDELKKEAYFRVHATPGSRQINLKVLPDELLSFTIRFRDTNYTYLISKEGIVISTDRRQGLMIQMNQLDIVSSNADGQRLRSEEFLRKNDLLDKRNLSIQSFLTPHAEVLFTEDSKKKITTIYTFDR